MSGRALAVVGDHFRLPVVVVALEAGETRLYVTRPLPSGGRRTESMVIDAAELDLAVECMRRAQALLAEREGRA